MTPLEYATSGRIVAVLVRLEGRTANGRSVDMLTVEWFHVEKDGIVHQRVLYWNADALR